MASDASRAVSAFTAIGLLVPVLAARLLPAQEPAPPLRSVSDSTAIEVVLGAGRRLLQWQISAGRDDPAPRPWRIIVADSTIPAWHAVPARLLAVLHGRAPVASDTESQYISFCRGTVRADTLMSCIEIGSGRRCLHGWSDTGSEYDVRAVRKEDHWDLLPLGNAIVHDRFNICPEQVGGGRRGPP